MNKPITSNKFVTDLWSMTQMLIEEAVLAEREACAKVAERFEPDEKTSYVTYASTAIRARGQA
jgi:hypothetical protein